MSITDPVECDISKILEGDVSKNKPISECLLRKFAANLNGIQTAWKLECKEFTGSGSWTTPKHIFGAFLVVDSITNNFTLNQFAGEIVSLGGERGFRYFDNLQPETTYFYQSGGTMTVVCLSC